MKCLRKMREKRATHLFCGVEGVLQGLHRVRLRDFAQVNGLGVVCVQEGSEGQAVHLHAFNNAMVWIGCQQKIDFEMATEEK